RNAKNIRDPDINRRRDAIKNVMGYRDSRVLEPVLAQVPVETDAECLRDLLGFIAYLRDPRATPTMAKCLLEPSATHEREIDHVLRAIAALADSKSIPTLRTYCRQQIVRVPQPGDKRFTNYWNIHGSSLNWVLAETIAAVPDPEFVLPLILMNSV